ncbi:site-2 protease family protein [Aquisphaera insulae]|uniref:site-2 protease family protein n=1 Tax=Aquisphaera insulae TaxID=2712864 RepID=UPI0021108DC3|nr:site-2 protease family protein [Aquisphaera insulae]
MGSGLSLNLLVSICFLILLFGCIVLHELGHALMARRFGIGTLDITLSPIGGVARLERLPRAPGAEILIALAGPAVTFAIVLGLFGLQIFGLLDGGDNSALGDLGTSLLIVNLVLGLFNLIPAFPMDGGRVLRAVLSGWLGRVRATSIAATIGRAAALAFGVYGLVNLNLLYVALAAYLYIVAAAEEGGVIAEERRRGFDAPRGDIWAAPPGYHWVHRGDGVWQLAPIVVRSGASHAGSTRWTH